MNASPKSPNSPRPSLKDVARRSGVSLATASYALQNHPKISAATRKKVREAAEALDYRANVIVSRLMAELRSDQGANATLAWVNCSPRRDTFVTVPWLRGWLVGVRNRAERLGYRMEELWLHEKEMSSSRLVEILTARGIEGVILAPTRATEGIVPFDISTFPVVSMSEVFSQPVVHQASTNNHANVVLALEEMRRLGYRKIGFFSHLLSREIAVRQFTGAFLEWQGDRPESSRSRPLTFDENSPEVESVFGRWVNENRFDALLSTGSNPRQWLSRMGLLVPRNIGFAHMNLADDVAGWSGIDPRIDQVAAAAVDLLIGQIHRHEAGPPSVPKVTTITGVWVPGNTLPPRDALKRAKSRRQ